MAYEKITLEIENRVATLTLNDPAIRNAVSPEMLNDLSTALEEIKGKGADVRCLLITGAGKGFCAGAQLNPERMEGRIGDGLRNSYHPIFLALRDLPIPIVTAVNGAAAGVGMSLALMGDIVCASKNAFFLQAFVNIGLVPDGGSTYLLPRMVGWARAMELSLLGERLPAETALEWGLINRLYEDPDALLTGAREMAERLAKGPAATGLIRRAYAATFENDFEEQLELEAALQDEAGVTQDFVEGVSAFLEKREAQFKGS